MAPSTTVKPPTGKPIGYTDLNAYTQFSAIDPSEHLADLLFPQSVVTYAEMRRDPQLAAVLAGITLPIRRASWAIDPTGCNPAVAQRIADDMGLPLAGVDDPGPARLRGMSWAEHLRTALLHLTYGFYGYELLADVSSGQARLVNAYQRTPSTVVFIHSLPNGDFGGISQLYHPDTLERAEISADRMVWYAHDIEGSAHHGNSILRPGFSSWLLKQDLRRVLGGSNRRWGMGVSTARALPGTTPTPEQMAAAAQLAQSARAGEVAGAAIPPGFVMEILGMQGSAPNTIEALRWVDSQMSGMVLSRWMDLGNSQTGSRALGEAFIDVFLLSIQSIADSVADTATRQIAARLVEWNEGFDEPVPRVVVADVGSRHEVTADALNVLMQSGALTADPQLEEWVRRTFKLPERDPSTPWRPPVAKIGGGATDGSVTDGMALAAAAGVGGVTSGVAAGRPRRPRNRQASAGQLELPIAAASDSTLTADEQASGADFEAHQQAWQDALNGLKADWPDVAQPMVDDLSGQAADDVDRGDLAALGALVVSAVVIAALADAIGAAMTPLALTAAKHVVAEARSQGKRINAPVDPGADRIGQVAHAIAGVLANGYASAAARKALQVASATATAEQVRTAIAQVLDGMGTADAGWVADNLSAALSAGWNAGRLAVLEAHPPKYLVASEHHDQSTCTACEDIAGTRFDTIAEAEAAYPAAGGGFVGCLGGLRCRGQLLGIWK